MILVLKYVQNFIKIYKTLAGTLMHACPLCMRLHFPSQEKILYGTLLTVRLL